MDATLDKGETLMGDLIRQGQADGAIRAGVDSEAAARLIQGMHVVGKTGRSRTEMTAVDEVAMKQPGQIS